MGIYHGAREQEVVMNGTLPTGVHVFVLPQLTLSSIAMEHVYIRGVQYIPVLRMAERRPRADGPKC